MCHGAGFSKVDTRARWAGCPKAGAPKGSPEGGDAAKVSIMEFCQAARITLARLGSFIVKATVKDPTPHD
jgi:hypothetical protein